MRHAVIASVPLVSAAMNIALHEIPWLAVCQPVWMLIRSMASSVPLPVVNTKDIDPRNNATGRNRWYY